MFVIRHNGTHSHISTGIKLEKKYWDKDKGIKKGAPRITDHLRANSDLSQKLADIQSFISKLTSTGEIHYMNAAAIKQRYENKKAKEKYNFNTYYKYSIETKKPSTARIYQVTLDMIEKYSPGELRFSDITVKFLRDLELYLNDNGSSINNTSLHMRNIRSVFNMAIDDEVIELNLYPFRKYKIKKEKTVKRNLTIEELRQFKNIEIPGVPGLSRDVFMLSFYLIGINLKDLAYLKKENIQNGRLIYKRMKTGHNYSIKLEPEAKKLIKKLSGKKYLINPNERYVNYDAVKKEINKKLKKAAKKAEINKPISTYYARHSWATIASDLDIPKETISAALGHEIGSRVTGIYIDYDQKKVDQANRKVIDLLQGKLKYMHLTTNSNM
ncbi:MAG: site-specific integrase [Bacteroidales bacterium]|nr:site-specific integrase [Bacteroidales bacterium]